MQNQVIRDPSVNPEISFIVVFNDRVCSPAWTQKGPAQAYLSALEKGTRKPEYAQRDTSPRTRARKVRRGN